MSLMTLKIISLSTVMTIEIILHVIKKSVCGDGVMNPMGHLILMEGEQFQVSFFFLIENTYQIEERGEVAIMFC